MISRRCAQRAAGRKARKKISKKAYSKILYRDAKRDSKTRAVKLKKSRVVYRYTSKKRAYFEKKNGIAPRTHMTAKAHRGRPVSAETAKKRYGLRRKPTVRMKILVPKGQPVRKNKVIGGKPGYGEWTSTKKIPGKNIISVHKIK